MAPSPRRAAVLLCVPLLAAACGQQRVVEAAPLRCGPDPAVEAKLSSVMEGHVAAHLALDPVAAAADYTEDVWFKLDDGAQMRTRQAMEDLYRQMYETVRLVDFEHTDEEVLVCGDAAHAVGHYTETVEAVEAGGERTVSRFHYMLLWRLQPDGSWKVSRGALIGAPVTT